MKEEPTPSGPTRRRFLGTGTAATVGLALFPGTLVEAVSNFDLVLSGGTILDGTGGPPWTADIGLVGDTIAAIGKISHDQAKRTQNVAGMAVSPGFIDIHSHSDYTILRYPTALSRARQGVTTEITGNCGSSMAPLQGMAVDIISDELAVESEIEVSWTDFDSFCTVVDDTGVSVNQAMLAGHGVLRMGITGMEDRPMSADELRDAVRNLQQAMDEGAWGLSTGLEYTPGNYAPTDEIVALARVVARRGGLYASHIRNEERALLEAVDEAIAIGRRSGCRVQISHLKAAGRPNWAKQRAALDLISAARSGGVEVLADAYPYPAYSTTVQIFVPAWAQEGGWDGLGKRLADPGESDRIRDAMIDSVAHDPGAWDLVVISSVKNEKNRPMVGKNLAEIAEIWKMEPVDAALRLLIEEEGTVSMIGHGMDPTNVEMVLSHPLVMIGSDGVSMAPEGPAANQKPHPRSYGTYPRVLGYYSREREIFDLATAVKKCTSMPADQVGLADRGRIARGKKADLVVFDPEKITDRATFDDPHQYAEGIHHVLVNGTAVIEDGIHTGALPGRMLRRG
jgi:N-acyl-D-amino-acid deacylase